MLPHIFKLFWAYRDCTVLQLILVGFQYLIAFDFTGPNANQTSTMTTQNSQASNNMDPATMKRAFESLGLQYNQNNPPHNAPHSHQQMGAAMQNDGNYDT